MRSVLAIARRLMASNKIGYSITLVVVVAATSSGDVVLSNGNYTWLLALISPFFFVFYDFPRLLHLGVSKKDYLSGCITAYALLAFLISLLNTVIHLVIDPLYGERMVINMMDVCAWMTNGAFVAFLQQLLFLFMTMVFLHLLLSMQEHWYGWLLDALLIAIICIFTPIAPLRALLASFFRLVMFNGNALLHISVTVFLTLLFTFMNILVLKNKTL